MVTLLLAVMWCSNKQVQESHPHPALVRNAARLAHLLQLRGFQEA